MESFFLHNYVSFIFPVDHRLNSTFKEEGSNPNILSLFRTFLHQTSKPFNLRYIRTMMLKQEKAFSNFTLIFFLELKVRNVFREAQYRFRAWSIHVKL